MKLTDGELMLIRDSLGAINITSFGPTKKNEWAELLMKIEQQLDKHKWVLKGSIGMYDNNYVCRKCGISVTESSDHPYEKPDFGCKG